MGFGGTAVGASPMQVSMRIVLMVVVVSSLVSGLVGGLVVAVLDDDGSSEPVVVRSVGSDEVASVADVEPDSAVVDVLDPSDAVARFRLGMIERTLDA